MIQLDVMRKFNFLLVTVIAVGAMLAIIPTGSITHVAKASTCSSSASFKKAEVSTSTTKSGSCSTGSAFSRAVGRSGSTGGSASSCTSVSSTSRPGHGFGSLVAQNSISAVSCSSHAP